MGVKQDIYLGCYQSRGGGWPTNPNLPMVAVFFWLGTILFFFFVRLKKTVVLPWRRAGVYPQQTHGNKKSSWGFIAMDQIVILMICFG